jgi:ABC-type multidrug transport system fused ATPase/permease subunit
MKIILRNLLEYIKAYRSFFAVNIFITLLNSALQVAIPLYFKFYIDKISTGSTMSTIIVAVAIFAVMIAVSDMIAVLWHYMLTKLGANILFDIRLKVMRKLDECSYEDAVHIGREKLKHILFNDTLDIFRSMANFTSSLFAKGLILLLIFSVLFILNIKIGLILFAAFVLGLWVANYSRRRIKSTASLVNKEFKNVSSFFDLYVESLRSIKTNLNFASYQDIHLSHNASFLKHALNNDKVQVLYSKLLDNINYIFSIVVITYIIMVYHTTSAGNIVLILFYTNMVFRYANEIETILSRAGASIPAFEHVEAIIALPAEKYGNLTIPTITGLEIKNLSFTYSDKTEPTLKDVNLSVLKGEAIHLRGANGSGKTTFINLLTGILRPTSGEILFNGKLRENYRREELQSRILYIGQEENFLNGVLQDYYCSLLKGDLPEERIEELLNEWNFFEDPGKAKSLKVDYRGSNLSAGQKRKLSIVKLLLKMDDADIIVIDELDANLDIKTQQKLADLKEKLFTSGEKIIFDITHDPLVSKDRYTRHFDIENGILSEHTN